jgi:hypothetical protein
MKRITLKIPRGRKSCRACGHTWVAAIPRWDRGHVLMERNNINVFVLDDIVYALNECVDIPSLLEPLGFRRRRWRCPKCGREGTVYVIHGLLVPAGAYGAEELHCLELTEKDFVKDGQHWRLKDSTIRELNTL